MPRSRGAGRGTRRYKGEQSGVTWATIPSGTTITTAGVDFGGGTLLQWHGGNSAWTGSSLTISHGFTTLTGFSPSFFETGCTMPPTIVCQDNGISGGVSLAVCHCTTSALTVMGSGGTVFWTACGTN